MVATAEELKNVLGTERLLETGFEREVEVAEELVDKAGVDFANEVDSAVETEWLLDGRFELKVELTTELSIKLDRETELNPVAVLKLEVWDVLVEVDIETDTLLELLEVNVIDELIIELSVLEHGIELSTEEVNPTRGAVEDGENVLSDTLIEYCRDMVGGMVAAESMEDTYELATEARRELKIGGKVAAESIDETYELGTEAGSVNGAEDEECVDVIADVDVVAEVIADSWPLDIDGVVPVVLEDDMREAVDGDMLIELLVLPGSVIEDVVLDDAAIADPVLPTADDCVMKLDVGFDVPYSLKGILLDVVIA
ncbi:hypothetical protein LTR62_005530 [Meristemomyces frigidus]|uniref:Uncharacterized protein n=1 Tax=Meristemomyces frigidus TaxID=1508187 RepID=A0AAN7YFA4_9PEZI|nr:hypothetical protein LTR62_005530 [Meristemomyces frigidus]